VHTGISYHQAGPLVGVLDGATHKQNLVGHFLAAQFAQAVHTIPCNAIKKRREKGKNRERKRNHQDAK